MRISKLAVVLVLATACCASEGKYAMAGFSMSPYRFQIEQQLADLSSKDAAKRAAAVENLSNLRTCETTDRVAKLIADPSSEVRREVVMNLGWTGTWKHATMLARCLGDADWSVRQAAAVALQNVTGMAFPFDGLAAEDKRVAQAKVWSNYAAKLASGKMPPELKALLKSKNPHDVERATRAIGARGKADAAPLVLKVTQAFLRKKRLLRIEAILIQNSIRALGRIGDKQSRAFLVKLLDDSYWAFYAAEALGDCGGEAEAAALLKAYPKYAWGFHGRKRRVQKIHRADAPKFDPQDRIPRVAHAIQASLCRINFKSKENILLLEKAAPYIVTSIPSDFDGTIFYEEEPNPMMSAWLLERVGLRQHAVNAAFKSLRLPRDVPESVSCRTELLAQGTARAGVILSALCRDKKDIPLLIKLTAHPDGWVRINACKALIHMGATRAVAPVMKLLSSAKDDADYGFSTGMYSKHAKHQGFDEFNDPCPRFKEAWLQLVARLGGKQAAPILIRYLNNQRNVVDIQHAAALGLARIASPEALAALRKAEAEHPFYSVRLAAREALWRNGVKPDVKQAVEKRRRLEQLPIPKTAPALVFIKGDLQMTNNFQIDAWRQAYSTTDSGPTYRWGRNLYVLKPVAKTGSVKPITQFKDGYVADCEVSYDGKRVLFARRGGDKDPWWHIWEVNADGAGLRQITRGLYLDVQPNYLPDGRIIFSSSRVGMRDEYHGYAVTGLTVMNADGTDIHCIGFSLGRDAEPTVGDDGRILFTRLELFYSRMKTEWNLLGAFPDGTKCNTLYGPERRQFWRHRGAQTAHWGISGDRHRALRLSQPQPYDRSKYILNTPDGPIITDGRNVERLLHPLSKQGMAVTTPYRISKNRLLCAAAKAKGRKNKPVDLGLYYLDVATGELTLIYNDPKTADFEARPLAPHKIPPVLMQWPTVRKRGYTAKVYCNSIYTSQHQDVIERGRYVRINEGLPPVTRYHSHYQGLAWKNHGGATGRVLGIVPVAADGSFSVEVPADRLFHIQVLDSDKRVVGNELIWQYARPGEIKGCIGCHEKPDTAPVSAMRFPQAQRQTPIKCLPTGGELLYRAKMWYKGSAPWEREERMRTVNAVNLIGRE